MFSKNKELQNSKKPTLRDANFSSYLVKDPSKKKPSLVERSLVRMEKIEGHEKPFVRVYQVVYAPARNEKRKDVFLTIDKQLQFNGKENVWLNVGNPLRAIDFFKKYRNEGLERGRLLQASLDKSEVAKFETDVFTTSDEINYYHGRPVIRSFLLPVDVYKEITENAIQEHQLSLGKYTRNSDQTRAPDQYAINKEDLSLVRKYALPSSLVSYVLDDYLEEYQCNPANGYVKGIASLLHKLGMPDTYLTDEEISPENFKMKAEELHQLYCKSLAISDLEKEKTVFEGLLKNAKIQTRYPTALGELNFFQEQLGKQASFALIPHIIRDNFNEAVKSTNTEYYVACGLIKVDDDLAALKLENIPNLSLNKNTIFLFRDALYYSAFHGRKISLVEQTALNAIDYARLKEKITENYRLAERNELDLVGSLTGLPEIFQRECEFAEVKPSKWTEEQEFTTKSPGKFTVK
jgi:hypothetical protein